MRTRELAYFSKHGKPIWSEPRGIEAGYNGRNSRSIAASCSRSCWTPRRERLGRENILTSHHLTDWTETSDGVRAHFIDKATGKPRAAMTARS